ncbi:hypothetical protein PRZ48_014787 [Zasmidium cellare]|uniref:Uncharacterized protein n=1 Tax=Zasmidium cellare TaxID=395010 RepID=A0ABR0DZG9_ZASCE|nr:hypothetical protein PRZ48_014787 [Zasmidium cellare]
MENILFYGDRDDASRRQVRSAAAQHSHRIGPRKPKSSKKSRTGIGSPKKRPLKAGPFVALGAADLAPKQRPSTGSSTSNSSTPPSTARFDLPAAALTTNGDGSPGFASTPLDQVRDDRRQQKPQTFRWKEVHGNDRPPGSDQHRLSRPPSDVPVPSYGNASSVATPAAPPRGQASLPPALVIERIPQSIPTSASHSRQSSGASTVSPSTRLPQYSWTEYPRYGLSHNGIQSSLQAMPQVDKDSPDRRLAPVPSGAVVSPGTPAVLSSSVPVGSSRSTIFSTRSTGHLDSRVIRDTNAGISTSTVCTRPISAAILGTMASISSLPDDLLSRVSSIRRTVKNDRVARAATAGANTPWIRGSKRGCKSVELC